MTVVAVVIPYYQKKSGILRRALNSVLAQVVPPGVTVRILVTDDGSPLPPDGELDGLLIAPPFEIQLLRQINAGAAAARNSCLAAISPDTGYIGFLDSDDLWEPQHLANALAALDLGYDYYFCNNRRIGGHDSYFVQTGFDHYLSCQGAPLGNGLYALEPADFTSFSLRAWTSLTPTIVFRRSIAPDLRFDPSLRAAGEDCFFLLQLMSRTSRICCSPAVNVTCAEGVNIFYSTYNWDDPGHLPRQIGQLLKSYRYLETLPLGEADREHVRASIRQERRNIAFFFLRALAKKRPNALSDIRRLMHDDPSFWRWFPFSAASVIVLFPLRRFSPKD
jgi:succinoglycan biosynthesis protein ExoW